MRVLGRSMLIVFLVLTMVVVLVLLATQTLKPKTHHASMPDPIVLVRG